MSPDEVASNIAQAWYSLQQILLRFVVPIGLDAPDEIGTADQLAKVRTLVLDQAGIVPTAVVSLTWQATLDIQTVLELVGTALAAGDQGDEAETMWRAEAATYMTVGLLAKLAHINGVLDEESRE